MATQPSEQTLRSELLGREVAFNYGGSKEKAPCFSAGMNPPTPCANYANDLTGCFN